MKRTLILLALIGLLAFVGSNAVLSAGIQKPESGIQNADKDTRYIYIPYPDLDAAFGPGQRGVMLSKDEYERLAGQAAQAAQRLKLAGRAPIAAALLNATYTGRVTPDQATIQARFDIEVLGLAGDTVSVPFDVRGAVIDSARIDSKSAALIGVGANGRLMLFIPNAQPGRHTLTANLLARTTARQHDSILQLGLPPAPAATMTLTFDGDTEVAASVPLLDRTYDKATNKTTVRLAPATQGSGKEIGDRRQETGERNEDLESDRLAATRRPPEGSALPPPSAGVPVSGLVLTFVPNDVRRERTPLVVADMTARATMSEGHAQVNATVVFTSLRKAVDQVTITLPATLAVTSVTEPNLLSWTVAPPANNTQVLTVRLHEPQSSATVRLAADMDVKDLKNWTFPQIVANEAAVERGVLILVLPREIRAKDETLTNARRINSPEVPPLGSARAYAFWNTPYQVAVGLEPVPAETAAFNNVVLRLSQQEVQLTSAATVIQRAGSTYAVRLRIPNATPKTPWDVIAVTVSRPTERYAWQELNGDDNAYKDVLIALKDRLGPGDQVDVRVTARQVPDGWLDRTWREQVIPVPNVQVIDPETGAVAPAPPAGGRAPAPAPAPAARPAIQSQGQVGIWADPEFDLAPEGLVGLTPVDVRELKELDGAQLRLGYTFDRPPIGGRLRLTRLAPKIQVETVGSVSLAERKMDCHFQLNYTVEQAGQDTFRFVVEGASTGGKIDVTGVRPPDGSPAVAVKTWTRAADDAGPGETWIVTTQERRRGQMSLLVSFTREIEGSGFRAQGSEKIEDRIQNPESRMKNPGSGPKDASSASFASSAVEPIAVPTLRCLDVERQSGYLVVEGRDDTELTIQPTGLTKVEVSDVPAMTGYRPLHRVVAAYQYLSLPITLALSETRHPEWPLPKALVRQAVLTSVIDADGRCRTLAVFELVLAQPESVRVALPKDAVLWTAHVNSAPVKPQVIQGRLAIPVESIAGGANYISLLYAQPVAVSGGLTKQALSLDPPVLPDYATAQTTWDIYVPESWRVEAPRGEMRLTERPRENLAVRLTLDAIGSVFSEYGTLGRAREAARSGPTPPAAAYYVPPSQGEDKVAGERVDLGLREKRRAAGDLRQFGIAVSNYGQQRAGILPPVDRNIQGYLPPMSPNAPAAVEAAGVDVFQSPVDEYRGLGVRPGEIGSTLSLDVPLTTEGVAYRFERLDRAAPAGLTYVPAAAYRFAKFAAFGVAIVLGLLLNHVRGRRKLLYVLLVLIVASVLPALVGRGFIGVANGAFWGGLVIAAWYILRRIGRALIAVAAGVNPQVSTAVAAVVLAASAIVFFIVVGTAMASGAEVGSGIGGPGSGKTEVTAPDPASSVRAMPVRDAVIVPYDPEHPERARESDQVYVPRGRFAELWNLAHPGVPIPAPYAATGAPTTPLAPVVYSAAYFGRLTFDENASAGTSPRVAFQAEFGIHVFSKNSGSIALPLGGVAIREVTLDGAPSAMEAAAGGYRIFVPTAGDHTLRILFLAPAAVLDASGRTGSCTFTAPAIPASVLELTAPAADMTMDVPAAVGGQAEQHSAGKTVLTAYLGPVTTVAFTWAPASSRTSRPARDTSIRATTNQLVLIEESAVRLTAAVHYDIAQGERQRFVLTLPADLEVESVTGANVRTWRVVTATDTPPARGGRAASPRISKTLELALHRSAATFDAVVTGLRATVTGARTVALDATGTYPLPLLSTTEAEYESGQVGVRYAPALAAVVTAGASVEQMNVGDFTAAVPNAGGVNLAYRYTRRPVVLTATVTRQSPRLQATVQTAVHVRKDEMSLISTAGLTVQAQPLHRVRLRLPKALANTAVTATDSQGSVLDTWYAVEDATGTVVTVNFLRGVSGTAQVMVSADLAKPTPVRPIALALAQVLDAERQTESVAVSVGPGAELTTGSVTGLETVDAAAFSNWARPAADERLVLGFTRTSSAGAAPAARTAASATLTLNLLSPRVTAESVSHLLLADTFIAHRFAIGYLIENAGVSQFRFALPAVLGDSVVVSGDRIRQTTSALEGTGGTARRVWTVTLQGEVTGVYQLFVYHEMPAPGQEKKLVLSVPRIDVLDVARSRNYIAIQNDSRFEVRPRDVRVAEPVPPSELPILPQATHSGDVMASYRCLNGLWAIDLDLIAHEGQEVQTDVVELMDATMVVERSGVARTQITYRLNNRSQQFLELEMPEKATLWTATVAGRPVKPAYAIRSGRLRLLIPLIKTAPEDLNYDAVIVFEGRIQGTFGDWRQGITPILPKVVSLPVNRALLTLYLPPEYRYFNDSGNLERTVESERGGQYALALLSEQERLSKQVQFSTGERQKRALSNLQNIAPNTIAFVESWNGANRTDVERTSGLFANRAENARARQLQREVGEAQAKAGHVVMGQVEQQGREMHEQETVGAARTNEWTRNPEFGGKPGAEMAPNWAQSDQGRQATAGGQPGQPQVSQNRLRFESKLQVAANQAAAPGRDEGDKLGGEIIQLQNGDPERVAQELNQMLSSAQRGGGRGGAAGGGFAYNARQSAPLAIRADEANRTLIILGGTADEVAAVNDLAKKLDTPASAMSMSEMQTFTLKNADAPAVAQEINKRLGGQPAGGARSKPVVAADARTNTLVVSGSRDDIARIGQMADEIDKQSARNLDLDGRDQADDSWFSYVPGEPRGATYGSGRADLGAFVRKSTEPAGWSPDFVGGTTPTGRGVTGGLLSLAIEIPREGTRLDFVMTQGGREPQMNLTISAVDGRLVTLAETIGLGLVCLFVALAITSRRAFRGLFRLVVALVLLALIVAGLYAALILKMYAMAGFIVAGVGVLLFVLWLAAGIRRRARRAVPA